MTRPGAWLASLAEARRAIHELNGVGHDGRALTVNKRQSAPVAVLAMAVAFAPAAVATW